MICKHIKNFIKAHKRLVSVLIIIQLCLIKALSSSKQGKKTKAAYSNQCFVLSLADLDWKTTLRGKLHAALIALLNK